MALPKQVQAQADALAAYEEQVAAAAVEQPKPEDAPTDPPKDSNGSAEPAPQAAPPSKPTDDDSNTWRQRYLSLQGQYNSQVPALQQQVQTLTESMAKLTEQLKAKEATPAPAPKAEPASELVTKNDVDAFGEDLVDLARRIAKEEFGKRESKYVKQIEALESQLAEAKGQVGQVMHATAQSASERFFAALDAKVPGWDQVQSTTECQEWLATRVPGTSITWDAALKDAANRRDLSAVEEVFDAFFAKHPKHNPKPAAPSAAKQELQRQVAPGKSSASAPTANSKRTYSGDEYQAESMRLMRLMQKGQVDEYGKLEAELNAALAEGRVRP